MTQPYIDVTEFIESPDRLEYDGTYYYDRNLYGIVHPLSPKYDFRFFGDYSAFNTNSPFPINYLIKIPDDGIKTVGMIDDVLILLSNNGNASFYLFNTSPRGEFIDYDEIENRFGSSILGDTYDDITFSPNIGSGNGAIFIKDNQEVVFHNIPTPSNIASLIDNRLVVSAAVNKDKHFCLVFDTGEVLYYNGNAQSHSSYNLIPQDILDNEDYSDFSTTNRKSPSTFTKALEVKAYDGFSLLTFDGNIIVWGGSFQDINTKTGNPIAPEASFNCVSLSGNGETYGVALRDDGKCNVWGEDVDSRLTNLSNEVQVKTVLTLPIALFYTTGQGKTINVASDAFPNSDPVLSGFNTLYDLNDMQEVLYTSHIPYNTNGYFFMFSTHENENMEPVKVDFKLRKHDEKYFIPIMQFMTYEPANINLEVYSKCKSEYESIGRNIEFSIVDTYYNKDGIADFSKVVVTPIDKDRNGVPDDPLSYKLIVDEDDFIIMESFLDNNSLEANRVSIQTELLSESSFLKPNNVYYADTTKSIIDVNGVSHTYELGKFYKGEPLDNGVNPNRGTLLVDDYDDDTGTSYTVKHGRSFNENDPFKFQWTHYSSDGADRIDPSVSSIMDMYVLTSTYDNAVRRWLRSGAIPETFPRAPSSEEIRNSIRFIEQNKSTSDQVIYIPAEYKILFGDSARPEHQAEFKIVKLRGATLTDNEIKSKTIDAINEYFEIDNWDFGESFYFTELAAHIHNKLSGHVASVVIVPKFETSAFGDLFQIKCEPNELFLSTATVNNVVITNQYTNQNLRKYR